MKKLLLVALSVCLLVAFALPALASADLTISTPQDLADFAASVNAGNDFSGKKVVLAANIDLSGIADWTPIGMGDHYFKGEFDGQGHTISNLTQTSGTRMGLFGLVGNAYLHDFTLKNVSFTANGNSTRIGAVAGNLQHWNVVKDITVDGVTLQVTGNDGLIGAAFGYVWKSQVSNVNTKNVKITVSGDSNCIAAHTAYGRAHIWDQNVAGNNAHWLDGTEQSSGMVVQNLFANCSVSGAQITVSSGSGNEIGGFFGSDTYNYHSNYFYHDTVTGLRIDCTSAANSIAGGFIAFNKGTVSTGSDSGINSIYTQKGFEGCSASGEIKGGTGLFGGFVGECNGRAHSYSSATTSVNISASTESSTVGGFAGGTYNYFNHLYSFNDCVATGTISGKTVGGFIGCIGLGGDGSAINVSISNCKGSSARHFIGVMGTPQRNSDSPTPTLTLSAVYNGKSQSISAGNSAFTYYQEGQAVTPIEIGEYDVVLSFSYKVVAKLTIVPPPEVVPEPDTSVVPPAPVSPELPQTGDNGIALYGILAVISLLGVAYLLAMRRQHNF